MTRVSIAMATYNGARYLEAQLDSFSTQSRLPDELVICDDGSTDETETLVADFADSVDFEVRWIANPARLGYNRNFEHAVRLCTGDLIFISDQDDVWFADKLRAVTDQFAAHPDAMLVTNDQTVARASGEPTDTTVLRNVRNLGFADATYGPGCCTAIRRGFLDIAAPFPGDDVAYDQWLTTIAVLLGVRLLHEAPLQLYRRHESNTSGSVFAVENASAMTLVAAARDVDIRPDYRARIASNAVIAERLAERADIVAKLGLGRHLASARTELAAESKAYADRLTCLDSRRLARLPKVARMMADGTYKRFSGYKSAVKDLVSP